MRPVQYPEVVVDREGRRLPVRNSGVAALAVRREAQRCMVRIDAVRVIIQVAARTGVRGVAVVAGGMAGRAVVRDGYVRSREREVHAMVERRRNPARFRVAIRTGRRELVRHVVRIRRPVVIVQVAARTGVRGVGVVAVVAGGTVVRDCRMCPVQYPEVVVDREGRRLPTRCRRVAACTVGGYSEQHMIGIGRLVIVYRMTGIAIRWRAAVSACMAVQAVRSDMRARQRKGGIVMVEPAGGVAGRVAGQASTAVVYISVHPVVLVVRLRIDMAPGTADL